MAIILMIGSKLTVQGSNPGTGRYLSKSHTQLYTTSFCSRLCPRGIRLYRSSLQTFTPNMGDYDFWDKNYTINNKIKKCKWPMFCFEQYIL
jgi:hypothetical protein